MYKVTEDSEFAAFKKHAAQCDTGGFIEAIGHEHRTYELTVTPSHVQKINFASVNDHFTINLNFCTVRYNLGITKKNRMWPTYQAWQAKNKSQGCDEKTDGELGARRAHVIGICIGDIIRRYIRMNPDMSKLPKEFHERAQGT